ncbi:hypothetical protein [Paractinoplanes maris]|uniref:hypothetical protein n=1 Tax=Paractinoplanes maris TaxID=1734446 RepID=UPI0020223E7A|nr:hypothetical protein [Actinoplanes maris]
MTQRIRDLLDEAVSGIEPGTRDPVGAVVRRGRSRRRRTVLAGALAVLAVLGGGGLAARQLRPDPPPRLADTERALPRPHVVDGVVVVGALRLPVPAGWRAEAARPGKPCRDPATTILFVRADGKGCTTAAILIAVGPDRDFPPAYGVAFEQSDGGQMLLSAPIAFTLPGGEPAWLSERLDSDMMAPGRPEGYDYAEHVVLPWSLVAVTLKMDGPAAGRIISTMRSEPVEGGRLALPSNVTTAELTAPDTAGQISRERHGEITDRKKVAEIVRLLGRQKTVADTQACARPDQDALRVELRPPARVVELPAKGPLPRATSGITVVISLGDSCQEAVSSAGGRVRFDGDAVAELEKLFGIDG